MFSNMNTDDVLELLAEHGNPTVHRTRNSDMASPLNGRDPNGVNWSVSVDLMGFHNDSGGKVTIRGHSDKSAKEAALMASRKLDEFFENGQAKIAREQYIKTFTMYAEMWIAKPGGYYHGDHGPKRKPRWEVVKNDPCEEPTELLARLKETRDQ